MGLSVRLIATIFSILKYAAGLHLKDNAYEGVTVALSKDLSESHCSNIVSSITEIFEDASNYMEDATSGLTFGSVTIIVSESWSTCGAEDVYMNPNVADLKVGPQDPVFGDQPWTQQPRGCGLSGDFIYLSENWINNGINKGQRLLHEWAKYRWGTFEEYGHEGDPVFPPSYRTKQSVYTPNYCTNTDLEGDFLSSCSNEKDCVFEIDTHANSDVTSSLMAVPQLERVTKFCTDQTHISSSPTKQNVLCNGQSIENIISEHPDLKRKKQYTSKSQRRVTVNVVKSTAYTPLVLTFETTSVMDEIYNRFGFLKEISALFVNYELPASARVGLVNFDTVPIIRNNIEELNPVQRKALQDSILDLEVSEDSKERNLQSALSLSSQAFRTGRGIILLVTRCTDEDDPGDVDTLIKAASGNVVWIVLYPANSTKYLQTFVELADATGGNVIYVEDKILEHDGAQYIPASVATELSEAYRQILHENNEIDVTMVDRAKCEMTMRQKCSETLTSQENYEDGYIIYVYHDESMHTEMHLNAENGACNEEIQDIEENDYSNVLIAVCNFEEDGEVTVEIEQRSTIPAELILVGKHQKVINSTQIKISASENFASLKYTSTSAPALYVQILRNNRKVVYASVTATILEDSSRKINLTDDGTGADITGNDGIYSGYILPVQNRGKLTFSIDVRGNDNSRLYPNDFAGSESNNICCGSTLNLPTNLDNVPQFTASTVQSANITEKPLNLNLPPGTIKDVQAFENSNGITLSFTAPGEDLTYGTVTSYFLIEYTENNNASEKKLPQQPQTAGSKESISISVPSPCTSFYSFSIIAEDNNGKRGNPSNVQSLELSCSGGSNNENEGLSAGAIAGIVIGCLLLLIILGVVLYFCCFKDDERNLKHTKLSSCSCCQKDKTKVPKHQQRHSADLIRAPPVTQIRSIHDLGTDEMYNERRFSAESSTPPGSQGIIYPLPKTTVPSSPPAEEVFPKDSFTFTYSTNLTKHQSQGSLHSLSTASPQTTPKPSSTRRINEIGVPVLPQNLLSLPRRTEYFAYDVREEHLRRPVPSQPPPVLPKPVRHNTQV